MNPGTMDDMHSLVQRIKTKQIMINDESASGIVRQLIEYIEQLQKDRTKSESSLHQIEIDYTRIVILNLECDRYLLNIVSFAYFLFQNSN